MFFLLAGINNFSTGANVQDLSRLVALLAGTYGFSTSRQIWLFY
jgi:hypothetical protein